jgi:arylsulfatase A-like enzyme
MKYLLLIALIFTLSSCDKEIETSEDSTPSDTNPNILLIIADDIGKDAINGFTEGTIKPNTPNIDAIRNNGLSFSNFWSYPTCSPTRASIITGKYGYRTGVKWAGDILDQSETVLQKYINDQTNNSYATAVVGKWHLAGSDASFNPETLGINYYAGLIRGSAQNYNNWVLTENGTGSFVQDYTTEKFTDLAIDWIGQQEKPWFMWLAHNAPHTPFHLPPQGMHSQGNLPEYVEGMDEIPYYMAAIEAMDFQIGRLLDSLPNEKRENTIIIFIGDNGTPNQVAQAPYKFSSAKGSLNQGGINVPMFVSGKGVTRSGIDDNLTSSTDLFSTIAELAGVDSKGIHDSKSFNSLFTQSAPIREFQYSEKKDGNKDLWTISNGTLKLIENANGNKELYNLQSDPYESNNLLDGTLTSSDMNAKSKLEEELLNIRQ